MPPLIAAQEAFKLALSMSLMFGVALWMDWDMPSNGALAIILISLGSTGASLHKGAMRVAGTTVGLAVGLFALGCFSQDRWLAFTFFFLYAVFIGYVMPSSRYSYAWYVAGFLPITIWSSTYMSSDLGFSGFHYASFRYLETTTGILIYTTVCALFWNRNAGKQLDPLGRSFFADVRQLFGCFLRELKNEPTSDKVSELRAKLAGTTSQILTTLDAAYADTPKVIAEKRVWEVLRVNVRALLDALELWGESLSDSRSLDLASALPGLEAGLEALDKRLAQINQLWQARLSAPDNSPLDGGTKSVKALSLDFNKTVVAKLSHADRALLMNFFHQLKTIDLASQETVRLLRVLAGIDSQAGFQAETPPRDPFRPVAWDPQRLVKAMFPALCFAVAFVFWVYTNPPGGSNVPSLALAIALMFCLGPMNPVGMIVMLMASLWLAVAPVYMFVMPRLSTGPELLTLIFVFTFFFGYLGGKKPVFKLIPINLFVNMTGISNSQHYSFMSMVDGTWALLLPLLVIAVVHMLWIPSRPERLLLQSLRRYFRGCERVLAGFAPSRRKRETRRRIERKRWLESMVLPIPRQLQAAVNHLDYRLFPDNDPEKVGRLINGLQSLSFRIEALEAAHTRVVQGAEPHLESLGPVVEQLRERVQQVFRCWSRFEEVDALSQERAHIRKISRNLIERLNSLETAQDPVQGQNLYAFLGSVRGLIDAMARTQEALRPLNWRQWAATRF